ncbi:hypothetical protein BDA96_03G144400 [Sorghum bicolor]|uniref:Uncharacterized protein n=1 Tax=Sorghum bicolor TaxID=4558 RepID=A0A921RBG2_SORBI|nr:hypothetical protein BDA96_03G144400 [Sorghum bicolor]
MASDEIENISYLHDTMHELDNTMTAYYNSIVNSSDEFADSKIQFHSTHLHVDMQVTLPDD